MRRRLDFVGAVAYVAAAGMAGVTAWWCRQVFKAVYRPV